MPKSSLSTIFCTKVHSLKMVGSIKKFKCGFDINIDRVIDVDLLQITKENPKWYLIYIYFGWKKSIKERFTKDEINAHTQKDIEEE